MFVPLGPCGGAWVGCMLVGGYPKIATHRCAIVVTTTVDVIPYHLGWLQGSENQLIFMDECVDCVSLYVDHCPLMEVHSLGHYEPHL